YGVGGCARRASAAMMLIQMKKNHPDILAIAQDATIPPVQAHHDYIPLDSIALHKKRLDARQQPAIRPTKPAAPPPALFPPPAPAFGVPQALTTFDPALYNFFGVPLAPAPFDGFGGPAHREYIERCKSKGAMIALGDGTGPPTQFIDPLIAMQMDPNVIGPKIQYQYPYTPTPAQENPKWRMVPLGAGGRAFGCIPRGDPNGATCHIYCDRTAIPGRTCECHVLCNPLCPLAIRPRGV
ncbi:hypothetical protein V502_01523, partial [Pseudogymnoascus sp. VKM F-4520 (FW-2644)]